MHKDKRKNKSGINHIFDKTINRIKLKNKFLILYFVCIIIPLIIADVLIFRSIYFQEAARSRNDMENTAATYVNYFTNLYVNDSKLADGIDLNKRINDFILKYYPSDYDFLDNYYDLISDSFLSTMTGIDKKNVTIYANNPTLIDGQYISKLSSAKGNEWYSLYRLSGADSELIIYNDPEETKKSGRQRNLYFIERMTATRRSMERLVVISHDSESLFNDLDGYVTQYPVYVTYEDYIVYSNVNQTALMTDEIEYGDSKVYTKDFVLGGKNLKVIVLNDEQIISNAVSNNLWILIILLAISVINPVLAYALIEHTIVARIKILEKAFGDEKTGSFVAIEDVTGSDEISSLMRKYNDMVGFTNNLVQTVYKDKLKQQENDIARQNAELLALQSQINPHFLFNALESIRMHSLLKGEEETAAMISKLAIMERQNVEWGHDYVTVRKEIESVEAYLFLQSYRFGERLSFKIDVANDCYDYMIPKITIVTFVENACVHGIESKSTPGWIFVRVYKDNRQVVIEVEDTGEGMEDKEVRELLTDIANVNIDTIKGRKHVGILNACLRLKMITDNEVTFDIDSEVGVGMCFSITIPENKMNRIFEDGRK